MLSDRTIKEMMKTGDIIIAGPELLDPWQFQPVSVDLRLGSVLDSQEEIYMNGSDGIDYYMIQPGEFLLGSTLERIVLSKSIAGTVHGKSTRARQGLAVHAAGLVDPGFRGELTLEIFNMSGQPIQLMRKMLICQITFDLLSSIPDRPYGHPELFNRYQDQSGPTPAPLWNLGN